MADFNDSNSECEWDQRKFQLSQYLTPTELAQSSIHTQDLIICHANIVSLLINLDKLEDFLALFSRKVGVICLSETCINSNNFNLANLAGYKFFSNSSPTRAGGAGIFVSDHLICSELQNLRMNLEGCEDVWVELKLTTNSSITIGCVYRHPQNDLHTFQAAFCTNIKAIKSQKYAVLGDINVDYAQYNQLARVKQYADSIIGLGCEQIITIPTRIVAKRQSILDHVYINNNSKNETKMAAVVQTDISDHMPLVLHLKYKCNIKKETFRPFIRKIRNQDIEPFIFELAKKISGS